MLQPLSFADAAALLQRVRLGHEDLQGIPGFPLLVVELDSPSAGNYSDLAPATGWPVVVVGLSTNPTSPLAGPGPDILLTQAAGPSAPWVSAGDGIDRILLELHELVSANPQASTTLVQVLRATEKSTVDEALVAESLAYAVLQGGVEHRKWLEQLRRPSPDLDPSPCVVLDRDGASLRIALNRPARRNAYSARMRDELVEALQLAAADDSVEQVDISGRGPNFCSGGDLAEFGSVDDPATAHWIRMHRPVGWWMHRLDQRTTVRVHGACVGAGVELPAFARTVVSSSEATFALPEVRMGLIPGAGGTASIPRRIGRERTAWLALTGHVLAANDALEWGLVDRVSDGAD